MDRSPMPSLPRRASPCEAPLIVRSRSTHTIQAAALYRQALTVTIDPAERAVILERLADASYFGSHFDDAKASLREAIAWYEANGRTADTIRASTRLGAILLNEGGVAEGVASFWRPQRRGSRKAHRSTRRSSRVWRRSWHEPIGATPSCPT